MVDFGRKMVQKCYFSSDISTFSFSQKFIVENDRGQPVKPLEKSRWVIFLVDAGFPLANPDLLF